MYCNFVHSHLSQDALVGAEYVKQCVTASKQDVMRRAMWLQSQVLEWNQLLGALCCAAATYAARGPGRRVPEECPQGVLDLWRACTFHDPMARPSAADVQAALEGLLQMPRQSLSGSH